MSKKIDPRTPADSLPTMLGEYALTSIGKKGLHALAVRVRRDGTYELIVVPDHETTVEDILNWEHHTGEMNLRFHGRAYIELRIMAVTEFHLLGQTDEPDFSRDLVDAA